MKKIFVKEFIIILFISFVLILRFNRDFEQGFTYYPISIEFETIPTKMEIYGKNGKINTKFIQLDETKYLLSNIATTHILIKGDSLENFPFKIEIGKKKWKINKQNFNKFFKKLDNGKYVSIFSNVNTINPHFKNLINWEGDFKAFLLIFKIFISFFGLIFVFIFIRILFFIKGSEAIFDKFNRKNEYLLTSDQKQKSKYGIYSFIIGLFAVCIGFLFLEYKDSFYFTQDDTFSQFFPVILQAMRDFFSNGNFPSFNPIQFRGMPTLSVGYYSLANPLLYLSYFIAQFIFRNEFLTMEILAFINFIIGFWGIYLLLKKLKVHFAIMLLAIISFLFSGYNLISGRSWYYMLSAMAFSPFLMLYAYEFDKNEIGKIWSYKTILVSVLFFYSGNFQMWVYGMMFFVIYIVLSLWQKFTKDKLILLIFTFSIIAVLIFPMLINQVMDCKIIERGVEDNSVFRNFFSLLLPYPITRNVSEFINFHPERLVQMYYNGTVFNLISLFAFLYLLFVIFSNFKLTKKKEIVFNNKFLVLGALALLFSFGKIGIFYQILKIFPPFNKFTRIYKFLTFINLFFIVSGAIFMQRMYNKGKRTFVKIVLSIGFLLIAYHIYITDLAFCKFSDKPYPKLPDYITDLYPNGANYRILGNATLRSDEKNYVYSLQLNFASVYEIPSLTGYDIFENYPIELPKNNFDKFGVKYIIDSDFKTLPYSMPSKPRLKEVKKKLIFKNKKQKIYEIPNYTPLVKVNGQDNINLQFTNQGIKFDVSGYSKIDSIFINYKFRKRLKAYIDDNNVKIGKTVNNSILILNPPEGKEFVLKYETNFLKYFIFSLILSIIIAVSYELIFKKNCRK